MPSKYPVLSPDDVTRILERAGFSFVSQKGSHMKYSDGV
ncbi:MAG: type II toxin-antitoxin system HicA family toxin [Lachnospiraceae bacterium]|nr:type II toxin-antitoxin system HicA family toxin [Lachnospiraceae bacterium]